MWREWRWVWNGWFRAKDTSSKQAIQCLRCSSKCVVFFQCVCVCMCVSMWIYTYMCECVYICMCVPTMNEYVRGSVCATSVSLHAEDLIWSWRALMPANTAAPATVRDQRCFAFPATWMLLPISAEEILLTGGEKETLCVEEKHFPCAFVELHRHQPLRSLRGEKKRFVAVLALLTIVICLNLGLLEANEREYCSGLC